MKKKTSCAGARPAARRPRQETKVFLGFWAWPDTKKRMEMVAERNRQSLSACINGAIEDFLLARRSR